MITGKGPSNRHEIFYFGESELGAVRIDDFKYRFIDQPGGWLGEKTKADVPYLTNLRLDPFERTGWPDSGTKEGAQQYFDWFKYEFWRFVFVQQQVEKLAMTAIEFPPMQKGASFNLDAVKAKIEAARAAMSQVVAMASADSWRARRDSCAPAVDAPSSERSSTMKPIVRFPAIDRRILLSSLAMLPVLSASLRSTSAVAQAQRDPLPSWNEGATKASILDFVARVTTQGGPYFVPAEQRIATFDNDGTLWIEQPMYVQLAFALDRVKAMAPMHPEWKTKQPFAAVLDGDLKALAASGEKGLVEIIAVTHAGMTTAEFEKIVTDWLATARDHRFKRPYTELVYQPMLELLAYLRANGFKTFIVSGGGIEFMRPWTERIYGIPPEQVVGSSIKTRFEMQGRRANAVPAARHQLHRRQGRQADRHQRAHRPPSDRRLRQLRRRSRNAAMGDARRQWRAVRPDRPPHRCGARICLRPPSRISASSTWRWTPRR